MPVLPTTQNMQRATPQPSRNITGVDLTQQSRAMAQLGGELQQVGASMASQEITALGEDKKINDEYDLATANAMITQADVQSQLSLRDEPDYTKHAVLYSKSMGDAGKQALETIREPRLRKLFEIKLQNEQATGLLKIDEYSRAREKDAKRAYLEDTLYSATNLASQTDDQDSRQKLVNSQVYSVNAAIKAGHISQEEGAQKIRVLKATVEENQLLKMPPEQQIAALSTGTGASDGSKETSINKTLDLEKGYDPNGGNNGKPSVFGIDQHYFPQDFEKVNALYQAGDKEGARKLAFEFYDKNFWTKNDAESIPANTRDIVLDAMVMSGSDNTFSKNLVAKAKNGASREELLTARQDFYNSLIEQNPEKYGKFAKGWTNRLNAFSGGDFPNIPADTRTRIASHAKSQLSREAAAEAGNAWNLVAHGTMVDDSVFDNIIRKADMLGDGDLSFEISKMKNNKNELVAFTKDTLANNQKELAKLQKAAETNTTLGDKLGLLNDAYTKKAEALSKDPMGYYQMSGDIKPTASIFEGADDQRLASMSQRINDRKTIMDTKGVDIGLFSNEEKNNIAITMRDGTIQSQADMVYKLQSVITPDQRNTMAAQLKQDVTLQAAFMMNTPDKVMNVLSGAKTDIPVSAEDLMSAVKAKTDGVLFDNNAKNTTEAAVIASYKALHNLRNPSDKRVNETLLDEVVQGVFGKTAEISPTQKGVSKILLRDKDNPDVIDDRLYNLRDEQLPLIANGVPLTIKGEKLTAADIRKHGVFYSNGYGKLSIFLNNKVVDTMKETKLADGTVKKVREPFTISVDKLQALDKNKSYRHVIEKSGI